MTSEQLKRMEIMHGEIEDLELIKEQTTHTCRNLYNPYEGNFECSECNSSWLIDSNLNYERLADPRKFIYCPNCGGKIIGGGNDREW